MQISRIRSRSTCVSIHSLRLALQHRLPAGGAVRRWRYIFLLVGCACIPIPQAVAQTGQPVETEIPVVSIWRSGSEFITEGQDAVIVLTADPAPATELTVNLRISQYRLALTPNSDNPQLPIWERTDLIEEIRQASIETSGESRFALPTEDDDKDEPIYTVNVHLESGDGYSLNDVCGRSVCLRRNVYATEPIYTNPGSALFQVRDNDGPQSELARIVKASEDLLELVNRGLPTAAEVFEFEHLTALSAEAATDMFEGGVSADDALDLLRSSRIRAEAAVGLVLAGLTIAQNDIRQTIGNAASAVELYQLFPPDQWRFRIGISPELNAEIRDFLIASGSIVGSLAIARKGSARIDSVSGLISEIEKFVLAGYRSNIDETAQRDIASISHAALEALLNPIASKLGIDETLTDTGDAISKLGNSPHLMREVLEHTGVDLTANGLAVSKSFRDLSGRRHVVREFAQFLPHVASSLRGAGLSDSEAELLAQDLSKFVNPDWVSIGGSAWEIESANTVSGIIDEALGGETKTSYADNFLVTTIRTEDMIFAVQITSVKVISREVPDGWFTMNDGSFVLVRRGLAIGIAPSSLDIVSFAGRINELGYAVRVRENGAIVLTGDEMNVSGTFSYAASVLVDDRVEDGEPNFGACSFLRCIDPPADTNPASPDHYFTIGYTPFDFWLGFYNFGTDEFTDLTDCESDPAACQIDRKQRFLPILAHDELYDLLASFGLTVATDRFETGIILIAGLGRFRPAFEFEGKLPDSSSGEPAAIRFAGTDANGDGTLDYHIRTGDFIQLLYGVP